MLLNVFQKSHNNYYTINNLLDVSFSTVLYLPDLSFCFCYTLCERTTFKSYALFTFWPCDMILLASGSIVIRTPVHSYRRTGSVIVCTHYWTVSCIFVINSIAFIAAKHFIKCSKTVKSNFIWFKEESSNRNDGAFSSTFFNSNRDFPNRS